MMSGWRITYCLAVIVVFFLVMSAVSPYCLAAPGAASGGYLAGYENMDPRPSSMSWWSTLAYIISLLIVFAFVVVMAYFASKFLSGRFSVGRTPSGSRILEHLPLGPNRSVCVVCLADKVLMLGVSEGGISLLGEVTDPEEIDKLRREAKSNPVDGSAVGQQISSIQDLLKKVPEFLSGGRYNNKK